MLRIDNLFFKVDVVQKLLIEEILSFQVRVDR